MLAPSPQTASALVAVALLAATPAQASVEISSAPTSNMDCSAGVCSPTAKKAVLNVTDLTNMLSSGDVKIITGASAITITVESPFSWTSTHRLTLDAYQTVSFRAPVVVAGTGAVTITYNDGGTGGDLVFYPGAKLDFWDTNSSLVVSQQHYGLISGIQSLAEYIKANPAGLYALAMDYDAHLDRHHRHSPIASAFSGIFLGLGHAIDRLKIDGMSSQDAQLGFFSELEQGAKVSDIRLTNIQFNTGLASLVGGLAAENRGKIVRAFVSGTIISNEKEVGGLVGDSSGEIDNSLTDITLGGGSASGGLVARSTGTIANCRAGGSVGGNGYAGGLAVYVSGQVLNSSATVQVSSSTAGGLIAEADGANINSSFAAGSVSGEASAGGLVGTLDAGQISNSYATGSVTVMTPLKINGAAGGFVGLSSTSGNIGRSYSTGAVSLNRGYLGGFVGYDGPGKMSRAYWDLDTSNVTDPAQGAGNIKNEKGIRGLSDADLRSTLPPGFDPSIWAQSAGINNGYPYLIANPPQ